MRGRAETNVAFCLQDTIQSLPFPYPSYTRNSLWNLRDLSQKSCVTLSLVIFTKSISYGGKHISPFILSPLPITTTISEALKESR